MSSITGESLPKPFSEKDVQDALKDGVALCKWVCISSQGYLAVSLFTYSLQAR